MDNEFKDYGKASFSTFDLFSFFAGALVPCSLMAYYLGDIVIALGFVGGLLLCLGGTFVKIDLIDLLADNNKGDRRLIRNHAYKMTERIKKKQGREKTDGRGT